MKKLISCLFLGFVLVACARNGISPETSANNSIIGKWKWLSSVGGIGGFTYTPQSEGYDRYLQFTDNQQYTKYKNQEIEKTGSFSIQQVKSIYTQEMTNAIKLDNDNTQFIISYLKNDTLELADNFHDGFGSLYVRVKN